ncbi:MAG TPA: hypothetical protein VKE96_12205 [Vicinamibacterales bacterium]|nr:hypothetical protein [Vicinamibacterales bacterium]
MVSRRISKVAGLFAFVAIAVGTDVQVPRIWDDRALDDWATPLAGVNIRPGHYTSAEYYVTAPDNLRTYPVYPPDREPAGYWESLQRQTPRPLVDVSAIRSREDWIAAGERAFREIDKVSARTDDPELLRLARDPSTFKDVDTLPDGSILDLRWVVTSRGVELTTSECAACHRHIRADKSVMFAGPPDGPGERPYRRPPHCRMISGWPGSPRWRFHRTERKSSTPLTNPATSRSASCICARWRS